MLAVTPDVLFVRATENFDVDDANRLYWEQLENMATPWAALFCTAQDAAMISQFCVARAAAKAADTTDRPGPRVPVDPGVGRSTGLTLPNRE